MSTQKNTVFVDVNEGESFWQPKPGGGYVTIKVSPWNVANTTHTIFLQELPKGAVVSEHYHESHEEMFIGLSGSGVITIDGKEYVVKPECVVYVGSQSKHSLKGISEEPFRFMVVISPPGLEERLKKMGKPRQLGDSLPTPFESGIGSESHGVKRSCQ